MIMYFPLHCPSNTCGGQERGCASAAALPRWPAETRSRWESSVDGFDPYLIWLDIPPHERPVDHYRLFGLRPLESDPAVISTAADRVIAHVGRFQQTEHAGACSQLLGQLTAAKACLLDPFRKQAYDAGMAQAAPGAAGTTAETSNERPLAGPSGSPGDSYQPAERPLTQTPQVPGGVGRERQIAHSPPVPQAPASPGPQGGAAMPSGAAPQSVGVQPSGSPGVPVSPSGVPLSVQHGGAAQPTSVAGGQTGETPLPRPAGGQSSMPVANNYGGAVPTTTTYTATSQTPITPAQPAPVAVPSAAPPPTWADSGRTGEVGTVVAGQGGPQQVSAEQAATGELTTSRGNRGRQLRRQQRSQAAYALFGLAIALIVFFFGAIFLLAIFFGG